jgi:hypothetical protein
MYILLFRKTTFKESGGSSSRIVAHLVADMPACMDDVIGRLNNDDTRHDLIDTVDVAKSVPPEHLPHLSKLTLDFRAKQNVYGGLLDAVASALAYTAYCRGDAAGHNEALFEH